MNTNTAVTIGSLALAYSIVLLLLKGKEDKAFYTCAECKTKIENENE